MASTTAPAAAAAAAAAPGVIPNAMLPHEFAFPDSVEEAAALLGASITGVAASRQEAVLPPTGMHPAFAVSTTSGSSMNSSNSSSSSSSTSNESSSLIHRLYILRSLLRTVAAEQQNSSSTAGTTSKRGGGPPGLAAAPSILQVLKKLLGISTQLAAAAVAPSNSSGGGSTSVAGTPAEGGVVKVGDQRIVRLAHKRETPPLWSTPCRSLWVDCVVLCHALSNSSTNSQKASSCCDVAPFCRQMLALASIHPRSAKAAGGVRIAALAAIAALMEHGDDAASRRSNTNNYVLASQLAPWSLDVLTVCLKGLRSAGQGEPTFRVAAIRAACATATACRNAAWKNRRTATSSGGAGTEGWLLVGAMEDKAIAESIKVLKQAVTDKFPEVRRVAAIFAAVLAPLLPAGAQNSSNNSTNANADPLAAVEEVLQLAVRHLDDECPLVAEGWADAAARCLCTAIQYHEQVKAATAAASGNDTDASPTASRFGGPRKAFGLVHTLTTIQRVVDNFLVDDFVKAGGELATARLGGAFGTGGRAVRLGYALVLSRFLSLQSSVSAIGESRSITLSATVRSVLGMVGRDVEGQLQASTARYWSKADAGLVRLWTSHVLRHGLSEGSPEPTQIAILRELVGFLPTGGAETSALSAVPLNANQLQVVLIEVSHLVATLGEAVATRLEEMLVALQWCLSHDNCGVRHEAAVACVALAASFPSEGRTLLGASLEVIELELAQLVAATAARLDKGDDSKGGSLSMFRRPAKEAISSTETARSHEYTLSGRGLLVSMLVKELPKLPGGLSRTTLASALTVAKVLVSSQFNEVLTSSNVGAAGTCVRAGFGIISGVLATGPGGVEAHMPLIVDAWQKAGIAAKEGGKSLDLHYDVVCLDAALSSIVTFLKFCSELLLSIPQALSQVTILVEDMFSLLQPTGRIGSVPSDPMVKARLESATASLMEAFAWLPSGSFPLVADEVFSFATAHIRNAVVGHVTCSILYSLVTREDSILDAKPLCRASKVGQVGGARNIEETIILLTGEVALHSERESVLHLRSDETVRMLGDAPPIFRESSILELFASDPKVEKPPTPLHEVGTWRRPLDPSCSSKVRIVDAAIQAFSATFGLKDGKEQQGAMDMLESLVPPSLTQFARTIGINAGSAEHERRAKVRGLRDAYSTYGAKFVRSHNIFVLFALDYRRRCSGGEHYCGAFILSPSSSIT